MCPILKLANVFLPHNAYLLFIAGILFLYGLVPFILGVFIFNDPYYILLSKLTVVAALGILIGHRKYKFSAGATTRKTRSNGLFRKSNLDFVVINFLIFIFIFFTITLSASSIPIISALSGVDSSMLSEERGAFLKQHSGLMKAVSYGYSLYVTSILPFCIVVLFEMKHKLRFVALLFMLLISISFLVKAMFLNFLLPLMALFVLRNNISNKKIISLILCAVLGLLVMISLAGFNDKENKTVDAEAIFSVSYGSSSAIDFLVWRALVIPVVTARDTLIVHNEQLDSRMLLGSTSGFVSKITGRSQINVERMVFAHQFGGWNDIGNANSVFITGAYINFGILGVVLFGFTVGRLLLLFSVYSPPAMSCMAILFAFFLLGSSLIGLMLSSGFLVLLFWRSLQRWNNSPPNIVGY